MNRLIITEIEHNQKKYCAYLVVDENRKLSDIQLYEPQDETLLDHIYVGFVEKIVPNIQAAFVRIAGGHGKQRLKNDCVFYGTPCKSERISE